MKRRVAATGRIVQPCLLAGLIALLGADANAASICSAGLFGVVAQIVRVEPAGSMLSKRLTDGKVEQVTANDVICAGERLEVTRSGGLRIVEIYTRGQKKEIVPIDSFEAPSGPLAYSADALSYLSGFIGGVNGIKPPPQIPLPTAVRGSAGASSLPTDLFALRSLKGLPRQKLVTGVAPLLSWRGGKGPYTCVALSDVGEVVWKAAIDGSHSWCLTSGGLTQAVQLQVRDAQGQRLRWNIAFVAPGDVPRPAWLSKGDVVSPADGTAWAVWLWKSSGDEWRLHALAMLNQLAETEWSAGYLRDNLLAGFSAFASP